MSCHTVVLGGGGVEKAQTLSRHVVDPGFLTFYCLAVFLLEMHRRTRTKEQADKHSYMHRSRSAECGLRCSLGEKHCVGSGLYSLTLKISTVLPLSFTITQRGLTLCFALTGTT